MPCGAGAAWSRPTASTNGAGMGSASGPITPIRTRGPIAFAGLWECWTGPNGEELETACIVTTAANRTLAPLHDRMPAVIPPEAFDMWLDCDRVDPLVAAALLAPAPETLFAFHEVSTAVNRTANDSPDLIAPVVAGAAARRRSLMRRLPAFQRRPRDDRPAPKRAKRAAKSDGQSSLF